MILLKDTDFIGEGTLRACYIHPENPGLVIKVPVGEKKGKELANLKELKGYHALMREHVDLSCVSHCYGFVSTSHGKGLVCDCIRDDDGAISKTILDVITAKTGCDFEYIYNVAGGLCNTLKSKNIFIFDINLYNVVLRSRFDGTYQPYIIDLKGRYANNEFLPLSSYIRYFSKKKLERRCQQFLVRISNVYNQEPLSF